MELAKLLLSTNTPLIDVRSESEYKQGHIPGAINHPILNDEERKKVGTCYKEKGQEKAIELGYELVAHQFKDKIEAVKNAISGNRAIVYCWRGGLRSKIFTELLDKASLEVSRLENGYKSYRQWALRQLEKNYPLLVLGGATGCGKTQILYGLQTKGQQIIDLEGLANHKGSAYGGISMPEQGSNEQFENKLAFALHKLDANKTIWIENESRMLGNLKLPDLFFEQMRTAKVLEVSLPMNIRIDRILEEYAGLPKDQLIASTKRLEKRLGGSRMKKAILHLENNEFKEWIELMIGYYDKFYTYGSSLRAKDDLHSLDLSSADMKKNTDTILNYATKHIF